MGLTLRRLIMVKSATSGSIKTGYQQREAEMIRRRRQIAFTDN